MFSAMSEILTVRPVSSSNCIGTDTIHGSDESRNAHEAERLQILEAYRILDSSAEKSYDDIARLAAFICGAPICLISFFDRDRQWIKAAFSSAKFSGMFLEVPRSFSFCDLLIQDRIEPLLVPDMSKD